MASNDISRTQLHGQDRQAFPAAFFQDDLPGDAGPMHKGFTCLVGLDRRLQNSDARCLNLAQLGCLVALLRT